MGGLIPHVLWRTPLRRTRLSLAAAIAVASSAALVGVPGIADAAPKPKLPVAVQLLAMNDFHGRIAETSGGDSQIITGPALTGSMARIRRRRRTTTST